MTLFPPAFTPVLEIDTVLFGSLTEPSAFKLSALLTATPAGAVSYTHLCITRLRLSLVDQHKINEEQLKSLGAKGIVKIGNDGLQVVLGPEAELVAEAMKQKVK